MSKLFWVFSLAVIVFVAYLLMRQRNGEGQKPIFSLQQYSEKLNDINTVLKNIKCKPSEESINKFELAIKAIQEAVAKLIINTIEQPTPKSYADYKNAEQNVLQTLDALKKDTSLLPCINKICFQGALDQNNVCVCPVEYPVPIVLPGDDNIYCYSDNCGNYPHSKFVHNFDKSKDLKDPSGNKCVCDDGYMNDSSDPFCYNVNLTSQIEKYTTDLNSIPLPKGEGINSYYGKYNDFFVMNGSFPMKGSAIIDAKNIKQCIDEANKAGRTAMIYEGNVCVMGDAPEDLVISPKENCQCAYKVTYKQ